LINRNSKVLFRIKTCSGFAKNLIIRLYEITNVVMVNAMHSG